MRAVQFSRFGGPEVLEIVDRPVPAPGPGQIRVAVRAAGVSPSDVKFREGLMGGDLPQGLGRDLAGVVDALGDGVTGVEPGDEVFGVSDEADGAAEFALTSHWAELPTSLGCVGSAALPVALETATRSLDALGVHHGVTLLVSGASGAIGSTAVQLAVSRGARVIGAASRANHDYVRELGAEPVAYGEGPRVDRALDVSGSGVLPELIELAGGAENVVTIADFAGAQKYGVRFSRGEDGRAFYALDRIGELVAQGRFHLPIAKTFPLEEIADAHRFIETNRVRGRVVLTVG